MRKKRIQIISFVVTVMLGCCTLSGCTFGGIKDGGSAEQPISVEKMSDSVFNLDEERQNYVNPDAGLKNPYNVGINKTKFETEILYPAEADASCVVIDTAADYGVVATDMEDDSANLQRALIAAKRESKKPENAGKTVKVKLPAGKIYIYEGFYDPALDIAEDAELADEDIIGRKYGIVMYNIPNLTFTGTTVNGKVATEIVFVGELGFRGMKIVRCDNIKLTNFSVDWMRLPYSMGVVKSVAEDNKSVVVTTNADYPVQDNVEVVEYLEFDKDTNLPRRGGNTLYNHNEVKQIPLVEKLGENGVKLTFASEIKTPPIGTKVALAHQMHFSETFMIEHCKNVYVETVYLYAAPGMAFKAYTNENLYINRFMSIVKPGTDRLMTGTADILHLKNTKGEIIVTNSQIENSHDDAINVGGHFTRPYNKSGNKVTVRWPGGMWGTFKPEKNDILMLTDTNSMEAIGYYEVDEITVPVNGDGYDLTFTTTGGTREVCGETVTVETNISKIADQNTQAFANLTRTPKFTIKNSLIRNKRNRGLLIQTRNVTVENCAFSYVLHGAVQLLSEVSSFNESTPPKYVTIKNNKFLNNNTYDISAAAYGNQMSAGRPGAISELTIENNFMAYNQETSAIYLQGVGDATIHGNWIYKPITDDTVPDAQKVAISLRNVNRTVLSKNLVEKFSVTHRTIQAIDASDIETITLEDNVGIDSTELYGEAREVSVNAGTAAITIDGDLSDWTEGLGTQVDMVACTNIHVSPVKLSDITADDFSQVSKIFYKYSGGDTYAADDGIYISFDVTDEYVQFQQGSWWLGDGFEFFLSTSDAFSVTDSIKNDPNEDCLQMFIKLDSANTNMATVIAPERSSDAVMQGKDAIKSGMKVKAGGKGYTGEVFLPFSVFRITAERALAGEKIAMSFNFGDSDDGTEDKDKFMTFSTSAHPTTTNKMVPGVMMKFVFVK